VRSERGDGRRKRPAGTVRGELHGRHRFRLLSTLGYGTSPILVCFGLESQGLGVSLAAGLIAYSAATLISLPFLLWPNRLRHVLALEPEAAKWFTISGVMVCVSQMFLYMAYAVAPVSVVTPIQRLSIVFRIYFGRVLNPQHEVFGRKVYRGTAVSLLGALALSLSTDVILDSIGARAASRLGPGPCRLEMAMTTLAIANGE
jgi:uncharacterized membrane protein